MVSLTLFPSGLDLGQISPGTVCSAISAAKLHFDVASYEIICLTVLLPSSLSETYSIGA